jgi:uncharacterized protein (DUF1810 family)
MADDLERFVEAQEGVYERALAEIRSGRKQSHWMWFIFPQLECLGRSVTAKKYGIRNLAEASAYLAHPVLGPRLVGISEAMLANAPAAAAAVLGSVDAMKLRSCATLFAEAAVDPTVFRRILDVFYAGDACPLTLAETRLQT